MVHTILWTMGLDINVLHLVIELVIEFVVAGWLFSEGLKANG